MGANAPPSKLALRIVREAIKRSQPLDADKVAEAVDVFMAANSEWSIDPIVAFIVDRANTATSNPTAFVVGALKRPPSTMKLSPKVRAFRLLDHLNEVEGAIEDIDPDGYEEFSEANGAIALEADTGDLTLAEFLHAADTLQIRDFSKRIETAIAVGQCRLAQLLRPRSPLTEDDF